MIPTISLCEHLLSDVFLRALKKETAFVIEGNRVSINFGGANQASCYLTAYEHKLQFSTSQMISDEICILITNGELLRMSLTAPIALSMEIITQIKAAFKRFDEIYENAVAEKENQITFAIDKDLLLSAIENEEWHVTDKEAAVQSFLACLEVTEFDDLLDAVEFEDRCAGEDCGVDFTYYDEP